MGARRVGKETRERRLVRLWLGGCALAFVVMVPLGLGLDGWSRAVRLWNRRWPARVEVLGELAAAARHDEVVERGERLDAGFPARWTKHRQALHRARILELVGTSYAALGRKRRALDTLERLVAFDPRSWHGRVVQARALRSFGEEALAEEAYRAALALRPGHPESVAALVEMAFERGDFEAVVRAYAEWLDAWIPLAGAVSLGGSERALEVPIDGNAHLVELAFPAATSGELSIEPRGYALRVERIEWIAPLRAGEARARPRVSTGGTDGWTVRGMRRDEGGCFVPTSLDARLVRAAPDGEWSRLRLVVAAFAPVSAVTWEHVAESCRRLLRDDELAALRARTAIGGIGDADPRFRTPAWGRGEERP